MKKFGRNSNLLLGRNSAEILIIPKMLRNQMADLSRRLPRNLADGLEHTTLFLSIRNQPDCYVLIQLFVIVIVMPNFCRLYCNRQNHRNVARPKVARVEKTLKLRLLENCFCHLVHLVALIRRAVLVTFYSIPPFKFTIF